MDKLKELFESAVLNDESKTVLKEAFAAAVEAKEVELKAEYAQKLAESEQALAEKIPTMVEEALSDELAVIAEEVAHARTLEVQYAEKLTAFKESYAEKQEEQLKLMVAESVAEEIDDLQDDIELAKKHQFAMSMFESFKDVYERMFGGTDLNVYDKLKEAEEQLDQYVRAEKIAALTEGLKGDKREIAKTILEGVSTDKLEAKFNGIRDVLLSEEVAPKKEEITLTESTTAKVVLEDAEQEGDRIDEALSARLQKSIKMARK